MTITCAIKKITLFTLKYVHTYIYILLQPETFLIKQQNIGAIYGTKKHFHRPNHIIHIQKYYNPFSSVAIFDAKGLTSNAYRYEMRKK